MILEATRRDLESYLTGRRALVRRIRSSQRLFTQSNDSILVTPGSGATVATHLVAAKEHQVVMVADDSGHIQGSLPTYFYCSPPIAVGSEKLLVDIFNATGSGKVMDIRGAWLIPKLDAALTGALAVRVDLYRTSAVGTGGTAASADSATRDVGGGNFTKFDESNAAIPSQITARVVPTGGATISRWLFPSNVAPEESNTSMGYLTQWQNLIPAFSFGQKLVVRENTGLLFKQGAVASVGSVSILLAFTLE